MIYLRLKTTDPHINLATEEFLFRNTSDDVFMIWQNEPSIIIGKNQNAFAEISLDYVRKNGIHIARRITGGGAVYHDLGNVNYTFISSSDGSRGIDFERFTLPIIELLKNLGINAELSGRNDIVADGKKFSGNAQHKENGRILHHGTLLFDADISVLTKALNVDVVKLESKAIKSVKSRVVNLKSLLNNEMDVNTFMALIDEYVRMKFDPIVVDAPSFDDIDEYLTKQRATEWIFPARSFVSDYAYVKKKKFDFGLVEVNLKMKNDLISDIKIYGDFFGEKEISELESYLVGKSILNIECLLRNISLNKYIFGITSYELAELIVR